MTETFVDLSHHNATVDLAAYARAGHTRVALKATEGTSFTDPTFTGRWAEAGRAGLRRGAYHFARTVTDGAAQADRLLAAVDAAGGMAAGDWLVLDVEDNSTATALTRADQFSAEFCGRMVARGHETGLLYTGRWYANPAGITPADVPAGWRRLWLADYGTASDAVMSLPVGWTRDQVAARQYTNNGSAPGVTGRVDVSRVITEWMDDMDQTTFNKLLAGAGPALRTALVAAHQPPDYVQQRDPWHIARAEAAEGVIDVLRSDRGRALIAAAVDPAPLAAALTPLILAGLPAGTVPPTDEQVTAAVVAGLRQVAADVAAEPTP